MFKITGSLFAVLLLSGCVSTKNVQMDRESIKMSKPGSIMTTQREKPDFAAMTAGKAAFALFGAMAMISAGNEIIEENAVDDPADFISKELAKHLSNSLILKMKNGDSKLIDSTDTSDIASSYSASDLVLDVQTINWSFVYFPTDWDSYRVIYSAKIRLIDTRNKSLIAEGFCSRVPEENESAPSYDDLLNKQAAGLKKELHEAAIHCISEFKNNVLKV